MNKKIAIIDDEKDILNILERFLKRSEKFEIEVFENPEVALNKIKNGGYDLILLDIMMPQMNGIDFLKNIKESSLSDIKVIMMTAYSTQDKMINCDKIGADDYITKPFVSLRDVENKVLDNLKL
ncbi:MAG: response regulator [Epsilonproteobacteria bacterium]|nr:MAG: response regulator [Campylobacterota bacterium]